MASLISTVHDLDLATRVQYSHQRKLLKASTDKLILITIIDVDDEPIIAYTTSTDEGATWSSFTNLVSEWDYGVNNFDCHICTNDDIIIAYDIDGDQYFQKLTYSSGTWSSGSLVALASGSYTWRAPSITQHPNGDYYVNAGREGTRDRCRTWYSSNGTDWSTIDTTLETTLNATKIIQYDTTLWLFAHIYGASKGIKVYQLSAGSWSYQTNPINSVRSSENFAVLKIADNDIWIAYNSATNIAVQKWNGSSWSSQSVLTTHTGDLYPTLTLVNDQPVLLWIDRISSSSFYVKCRIYSGSAWYSTQIISIGGTDNYFSGLHAINSDSDYIKFVFMHRTLFSSSDYNIYYDYIKLSQIINNDFENWYESSPFGWDRDEAGATITQSSDEKSGDSAVLFEMTDFTEGNYASLYAAESNIITLTEVFSFWVKKPSDSDSLDSNGVKFKVIIYNTSYDILYEEIYEDADLSSTYTKKTIDTSEDEGTEAIVYFYLQVPFSMP